MFDPTLPIRSRDALGRPTWLFADGRSVPRVSGGDGPTEPGLSAEEIEARLARISELTQEELDELSEAVAASYAELREGDVDDAVLDALRGLRDARAAIDAEQSARETAAAERDAELARLDADMGLGGNEEEDEEGAGGEGEPGASADASGTADAGAAESQPEGERQPVAASGASGNRGLRNLDALRRSQPRSSAPTPPSEDRGPFGAAVITASADVPNMAGQRIRTADDFGRAFHVRMRQAQQAKPGSHPLPVMSIQPTIADDLVIPHVHNHTLVEDVLERAANRFAARVADQVRTALTASGAPDVVLAAGGPCVVRDRSFDVPFVADDSTPFTDSFPTVGYPRGGVEFYPPLCFDRAPTRVLTVSFTDTDATVTVTAGGTVSQADVGKRLSGPAALPAGVVTITEINSPTSFEMSAAADATAAGQALTLTGRSGNIGRVITAGEDAAGYTSTGGTTPDKACDRIDCPDTVTCDLAQFVYCLTIGNWVDRTFPEWVRAWRQSVAVGYAATWEEWHIGQYIAGSTVIPSGAAVFGATRDVLGRTVRMVEHITSARRLPRTAMWRLRVPDWFIPYLKQEVAYGRSDDGRPVRMSDAELVQEFQDRRVNLSTFRDESGTTAAGDRSVLAMPTAAGIPAFPGSVRTFLSREGSWVRGQGGTLDLSVVRDSVTNRSNDYQVFNETESSLCYRGCAGESYVVDHTVEFSGVAAGLIDPGGNPT